VPRLRHLTRQVVHLMELAAVPKPATTYSIRAVERVCRVLDLAQRSGHGFTLADVVEATDLPKSSAFRYLATLEAHRYVARDNGTGVYRVGPSLLPLHGRQLDVLAAHARPHLEQLRGRFEETINLGVLDGNRVVYLEIVESQRSMRLAARQGDRDHIHCTALGKAIAAQLDVERVRSILESDGMPPRTEATITDIDTYFQELGATRARGYALDNGENEPDGRCLAVPLEGSGTLTAISLSAPAARFPLDDVAEVAEALTATAKELVASLGGE
jgi:IclR family transcriptional regulator, acetate operon repressor